MIQQNTAGSEESAATSEDLSAQAAHMKSLLQSFQLADTNQPQAPLAAPSAPPSFSNRLGRAGVIGTSISAL